MRVALAYEDIDADRVDARHTGDALGEGDGTLEMTLRTDEVEPVVLQPLHGAATRSRYTEPLHGAVTRKRHAGCTRAAGYRL